MDAPRRAHRLTAWFTVLTVVAGATGFAGLLASITVYESTSEEVAARSHLNGYTAEPAAIGLLATLLVGALLARWRGRWPELAAVVPVLVVLPFLAQALWVAHLWSDSGLPLDDGGSWAGGLVRTSVVLGALGLATLAIGWVASRLGAGPLTLGLPLVAAVLAVRLGDAAAGGRIDADDVDFPVWFSLGVVTAGESRPYGLYDDDDVCGVLATGICERTVGPLGAGVHLLGLLALVAAVAVAAGAATRVLRRPRRRLTT